MDEDRVEEDMLKDVRWKKTGRRRRRGGWVVKEEESRTIEVRFLEAMAKEDSVE